MQLWDYLTVSAVCRTNATNLSELAVDTEQGRMWGLQAILNYYGRQGWELVSCVPAQWDETAATNTPNVVTGVEAIFKRPLEPGDTAPR